MATPGFALGAVVQNANSAWARGAAHCAIRRQRAQAALPHGARARVVVRCSARGARDAAGGEAREKGEKREVRAKGEKLEAPSTAEGGREPDGGAVVGKKVKLQQLLATNGVASSETCALLIRAGQVRVNRETVVDPAMKVGEGDAVEVRGMVLGEERPEPRLPRAQRDLKARELTKDYTRRVDGGFFAKYNSGRKR